MQRTATCHCQEITIAVEGEPLEVVQCHCRACQRRTGSAFNLAAWFPIDNVQISGSIGQYIRQGDLQTETTFNFCQKCGSNLFWTSEPGFVGIAVGCFEDPAFPQPTVSIYDSCRHNWLNQLEIETHSHNGESG